MFMRLRVWSTFQLGRGSKWCLRISQNDYTLSGLHRPGYHYIQQLNGRKDWILSRLLECLLHVQKLVFSHSTWCTPLACLCVTGITSRSVLGFYVAHFILPLFYSTTFSLHLFAILLTNKLTIETLGTGQSFSSALCCVVVEVEVIRQTSSPHSQKTIGTQHEPDLRPRFAGVYKLNV